MNSDRSGRHKKGSDVSVQVDSGKAVTKRWATRQDPSQVLALITSDKTLNNPTSGLTIHSQSPACSKSRALQTTFMDLSDCSCEARCTIAKANPPIKYRLRGEKKPVRRCPSCATAVPPDHEFCGKCGTPVDGARSAATETVHQPRSSTPSSSHMDEGRFPPGTLLAQRYRIVSLLGRGGMGEVYRANDLLLAQAVALKFLPAQWTSDEPTLARFRNEVRIARQISHPNVCRVYDIGEAEGATYLSMEYVDGEDLASLLRRIGRLPRDKALEIARQLCAGLAAAHDKGVVHRDLKPAQHHARRARPIAHYRLRSCGGGR